MDSCPCYVWNSSTVALGRAGEGTAFEGALKAHGLRGGRMPPFARHSFDVMLQGLFLHKDLVAPLALVPPAPIPALGPAAPAPAP